MSLSGGREIFNYEREDDVIKESETGAEFFEDGGWGHKTQNTGSHPGLQRARTQSSIRTPRKKSLSVILTSANDTNLGHPKSQKRTHLC